VRVLDCSRIGRAGELDEKARGVQGHVSGDSLLWLQGRPLSILGPLTLEGSL